MNRLIAFGVVFLAAACAGEAPPDPNMMGSGSGSGSDPLPVTGTPVETVIAGSFAPMAGYGTLTATGRALLIKGTGATTTVQIHVDGLLPATGYTAHVHALPCSAAAGGHYLIDPTIPPGTMTNEIWLHVQTDDKGSGDASVDMPMKARGDALSVVVHNPADTTKMMCADLINGAGMPVEAKGTLAPFAAAVAQDQTITGMATLTRSPGATTVQLDLSGLTVGATYMAHVHALPCGVTLAGGHYMKDPLLTPSTEQNELWPTVTVSATGTSTSTLSVAQHVARADAQSVVVHRMDTTLIKVACADLPMQKQSDLIAEGTGAPLQGAIDRGLSSLLMTASLVRQLDGTTKVILAGTGLAANTMYMAHVHNRPCSNASGGGHYVMDPAAPAGRDNEIWLEMMSSGDGTGAATLAVSGLARPDAQSIVIHDPADNTRLSCVDLATR